jgi:RNA polymerase sigma-70 factor, ECF subfamily
MIRIERKTLNRAFTRKMLRSSLSRELLWLNLETEFSQRFAFARGYLLMSFEDELWIQLPNLIGFFRNRIKKLADAEDLAQISVMKAIQSKNLYDPKRELRPWLYQIAKRTLTDYFRANSSGIKTTPIFEDEGIAHEPREPEDPRLDALAKCKDKLKPEDLEIFILRYEIGISSVETANKFATTQNSIDQRTFRIRNNLRDCIENTLKDENGGVA